MNGCSWWRQSVLVCTDKENLEILLWKRHCVWRAMVAFQQIVFYSQQMKAVPWPCTYAVCSARSALEKSSFLQVLHFPFGADVGQITCILPYALPQTQLSTGCASRNRVLTILVNESCKVTLSLFAWNRVNPPGDAENFILASSERNREEIWGGGQYVLERLLPWPCQKS